LKIKLTALFLFFFTLQIGVNAQSGKTIAEVGNRRISEKEFALRFKMVPSLSKDGAKNVKNRKKKMLYSIIAEKLWALAAEEAGYDNNDIMKKTFKIVERMYARDALYEREIKKKIKLNPADIIKGKERTVQVLSVKYLISYDKKEINEFYARLKKGADFESLLNGRIEEKLQKEFTTISFGETGKDVEDVLYSLKLGEFTPPIEEEGAFLIFKLYKIEPKQFSSDKERNNAFAKVKKIVNDRITEKAVKNFYKKLFAGKEVKTNGFVFWSLSRGIIEALHGRQLIDGIPDGEKIELESKDYPKLARKIGADTLGMKFVKINGRSITADEFLHNLFFEGFYTNNLNPNLIRAKLNSRVKRFIEQEMLADEAFRKGYNNLPDVKMSIEIWKDYYLANLFKSELFNSVKLSDEEVLNEFKKSKNSRQIKQVNIAEVLTDSLEIVNKVLSELSEGADLRDLALKFSKRKWANGKNGESGFFPVTMYGKIGEIAGGMKIGDIYGPLKTPDGYSVFELLGVKEVSAEPKDFENVKDEFVKKLKAEKIKSALIRKTVELADKYGVKINEQALDALKVNNLQMLVYKYFGFGGRMLAFPLTPEFTEWKAPWKDRSLLP